VSISQTGGRDLVQHEGHVVGSGRMKSGGIPALRRSPRNEKEANERSRVEPGEKEKQKRATPRQLGSGDWHQYRKKKK